MTLAERFRHFRRVSTPLVAVTTADPRSTIKSLGKVRLNGSDAEPPIVAWDVVRGHRGVNESGIQAASTLGAPEDTVQAPALLLERALQLPAETIAFLINAHRLLDDVAVEQAIWNLRDEFKRDRRTLVLLGPDLKLPLSLQHDVFTVDDPLPDAEQLTGIVRGVFQSAKLPEPEDISGAVAALQGLAAFPAEEAVAHNLTRDGINLNGLWDSKRKTIEQTPGLSVWRGGERFDDIGGVTQVKQFLRRILIDGKARPNAVVFLDEIEKSLAGAKGDLSGVSQDSLGSLLAYMQDQACTGIIFIGPPGTSKSMVAKAAGTEAGVPTIQLDLGATRGSLVGQSEAQLRTALKVITAVSSGNSLWIATCNSIASLPPELRRRFTLGTFFFDLPAAAERDRIWNIYLKKFAVGPEGELPPDDGWTGAEIKQCCENAWRMSSTLTEAAEFVVPVSRSAAEEIDKLRTQADGRFLSASNAGVYRKSQRAGESRNISL